MGEPVLQLSSSSAANTVGDRADVGVAGEVGAVPSPPSSSSSESCSAGAKLCTSCSARSDIWGTSPGCDSWSVGCNSPVSPMAPMSCMLLLLFSAWPIESFTTPCALPSPASLLLPSPSPTSACPLFTGLAGRARERGKLSGQIERPRMARTEAAVSPWSTLRT